MTTSELTDFPGARTEPLDDEPFLLKLTAAEPGTPLGPWIDAHRELLLTALDRCGVLLFRGFDVPDPDAFGRAARAFSPELLGYLERAAPRNEVADKVFTSTELSEEQWIPSSTTR
ncbi:hypothetical protein D9753_00440 [Streptomyces dangxiongensis]|uniref:TauD/TfdA-like domain-containing protein n=1 Tax=Streptomyces dangxiongensis TaxID=1442032 RepID=A0A3G2J692_9ACTN|nr:TauD/TfdA family dioxygenase [Streptomyces dangxiongensis]AYN37716.1 hypothetical protein D9753_00440 [Streptomyces dangxiongensis]